MNGSGNISVRKIGMRAMQIMLDMMMDLMNKIAREAAMILEKNGRRTFTVHDMQPPRASSCVTARTPILALLEMNIKVYANYQYNKWWDCVCKVRAAVPMAAAQPRPPFPSHP